MRKKSTQLTDEQTAIIKANGLVPDNWFVVLEFVDSLEIVSKRGRRRKILMK